MKQGGSGGLDGGVKIYELFRNMFNALAFNALHAEKPIFRKGET